MYFFEHLMAGILLGLLLYYLVKDIRLVPACAVGSVLPDLIDKPLGIIILYESLNYGRIYFHTLLVLALIFLVAYIEWRRFGSLIMFAVGIGVLSHQIMDSMWKQYWNWLWPVYGPFQGRSGENFLWKAIIAEISSPTEWILGAVVLVIGLLLWWDYRRRGKE
ncbi:MAG TPA: metal-dependent hydrolase [Methanoregulaceae archaeon]|nr:metal-dependent hydrolase [Methanoregulaceae archaeon]